MSKLTDRQKKQIAAEYVAGDGSISQQKLADKYHVSRQAISKILSCEKSREMLRQKKEENTLSMLAYLDSRKDTAQSLKGDRENEKRHSNTVHSYRQAET